MKQKTTAQLKKQLWRIFSEYVRKRGADANGINSCVTCGARHHWKLLQAGHYVRKSAGLSLYFDEKNVFPQCFACNIWRDGNSDEYALFLKRKFGKDILEELNRRKRMIVKADKYFYLDLIEKYKKLSELRLSKITSPLF